MPRREPTDAVPPPPLSRGRRRHTTPFLPRGPASIGAASATVRLSRQKPASDRHVKVTATVTDQPSRVAAVRHRNSWRAEEGGSPLGSSPKGWSFPAKTPAAPAPTSASRQLICLLRPASRRVPPTLTRARGRSHWPTGQPADPTPLQGRLSHQGRRMQGSVCTPPIGALAALLGGPALMKEKNVRTCLPRPCCLFFFCVQTDAPGCRPHLPATTPLTLQRRGLMSGRGGDSRGARAGAARSSRVRHAHLWPRSSTPPHSGVRIRPKGGLRAWVSLLEGGEGGARGDEAAGGRKRRRPPAHLR